MYSGKKHNYKTFPFKALSPLFRDRALSQSTCASAHCSCSCERTEANGSVILISENLTCPDTTQNKG